MAHKTLQLIGLASNVLGAALIFMFGYPPEDAWRRLLYVRLSRFAVLLVFCGFLLQLIAALYERT
jgi:hypothetical protein